MLSGKPFAAMSGFMPSGHAHLGHKMVMEEIIWHQQQGGDAFLAIADMESACGQGQDVERMQGIRHRRVYFKRYSVRAWTWSTYLFSVWLRFK